MKPILSIIILQYNNHQYFSDLFKSLEKTITIPTEIILADDCSKDGFNKDEVLGIVNCCKNNNIVNCIIQINDKNVGTVKNLNFAIAKARGEFVKIIAVDDAYPLDGEVIKEQCDFLNLNPNKMFVIGNIMVCDNNLNPLFSKSIKNLDKNSINTISKSIFKKIIRGHSDLFAIQSICFRKIMFDSFSFDERLKLVEDLPFIVWLYANKVEFGYIDRISVLYRSEVGVSTTTETFSPKKMNYYIDLKAFYDVVLRPYRRVVGSFYYWVRKNVIDFRIKYTSKKSLLLIIRYFIPLVLYFLYCPTNAKRHFKKNG